MPVGRHRRSLYVWYGDMDLAPHLWQMVGLGRWTVELDFHPPLTPTAADGRKALAQRCQRAVAEGVDRANAGRPEPAVEACPT